MAGKANKSPEAIDIEPGSIFLSLNQTVAAIVSIDNDNTHMMKFTNRAKKMVMNPLLMTIETPTELLGRSRTIGVTVQPTLV